MPQGQYGPLQALELQEIILAMVRAAMYEVFVASEDTLSVTPKASYAGVPDGDLATNADFAAQRACEVIRRRWVWWAGAVGEEGNLRIPPNLSVTKGHDADFTYDGLDGTRHFNKGGRDCVSSMVAFRYDGQVVAAAVGDVFGRQIVLLDPVTGKVWLIDERSGQWRCLSDLPRTQPLAAGTVLRRGRYEDYALPIRDMLFAQPLGAEEVHAPRLSIGWTMMQLWTEQVVLHLQAGGHATPWDDAPVIAISRALGMLFLEPRNNGLHQITPPVPRSGVVRRPAMVTIHGSRLPELWPRIPVTLLQR